MDCGIQYEDYLFSSFALAYGKRETALSMGERKMIEHLIIKCLPSYDAPLDPRTVRKFLRQARRNGKMVKVVLDSKFWKNGSAREQCDGWTYHLELYTPRQNPVYYDSQGNIFKKSPVSFTKEIRGGKIWSVDTDEISPLYITFDKKTIYNLFSDYPDNMAPEQIALVKKEMPYWAEFFGDRMRQ